MSRRLTATSLQREKKKCRRLVALGAQLSTLFLLAGCILVDDFSPAWEKGEPDYCMNQIAESLYLSEFRRDPESKDMGKHAHTLTLGNQRFLMLKKEESDTGGRMYHFRVFNGIFQRFRLNPAMRGTFASDYPNAPVHFENDTVRLAKLDDNTTKLMQEIASKPHYWEIEDQALYNTVRNSACKYDDRPLSIDEPPKAVSPKVKDKANPTAKANHKK